jgi:hypothetical protein
MPKLLSSFLRFFILFFLLLTFGCAQSSQPELWWWQGTDLNSSSDVAAIEASIDQAIGYGYTGVAFWDPSLSYMNASYWTTQQTAYIQQVVNYAHTKGLKTMAPVAPYGYSDNALRSNFNWAEGQHITGSQFTVNASKTQLVPVNSFAGLVNPGFESGMTGWFDLGDPNLGIDTTVFHSGAASGVITNASGDARFHQVVNVTPWRQYHVRYWLKTQNFSGDAMIEVYDPSSGLSLYNISIGPPSTQDWGALDFTFNSRSTTQPGLYFGVWGGSTGTIWFDDIFMEETSLVYVLRRPGTPLSIYNPNNPAAVYQEGADVNPISDPNISSGAGFVDQYHTPTTVTLPGTTSLTAGQTVAMDYYGVEPVLPGGDVGMCLTDTGPQNWLQSNSQAITTAFASTGTGYLLSYDEMRHMNSCSTCKAKNMTPGQLLGWHVGQTYNLFQSLAPGAPMYVWSDMFDPYHNAHTNYYYVEGDIAGSWAGLPPNITVMNWNLGNLTNSLTWFSGLNPQQTTPYRQIIAGYYDSGNGTTAATQEVSAALGIPGVAGLMYTTWVGDYSQMQAFASTVKSNWQSYISSLATNVSGQVSVTQTGFARNHATGLWVSTVTVKNTGGSSIAGPLEVVLTSLTAGVTMTNNTGTFGGSPYITVSTGSLAPGASASVSIQFANPSNGFIGYTAATYSGGL